MVASSHVLGGHIVTALPNALSNAFDCELAAAESYVDDTNPPTIASRPFNEREMTASGDGGFDCEALTPPQQFMPTSHCKAARAKRSAFRCISGEPIGELIGAHNLFDICAKLRCVSALACAIGASEQPKPRVEPHRRESS